MRKKIKILASIPARFGSRRFPGKALAQLGGKTLLEHIYGEVSRSRLIDRVVVATDSGEIREAVRRFGGEAVLTSPRHRTGSDRSAELLKKFSADIVVNVQADHLGIKGPDYDRVLAAMLADSKMEFATLAKRIDSEAQLFDPNRVKVLFGKTGEALWFSRYPIPFLQGVNGDRLAAHDFYCHIGVYFFRRAALYRFQKWRPGKFEKAESLEQLRIMENGGRIRVFLIKGPVYSIDTPDDLIAANKAL